jgi:PEP-CTERM motif
MRSFFTCQNRSTKRAAMGRRRRFARTRSPKQFVTSFFALVALCTAPILAADAARATVSLPGASSTDFIELDDPVSGQIVSQLGCGPDVPCSGIHSISGGGASATNSGGPSFVGSIASASNSIYNASVNAFLVYSVEVIGPTPTAMLDVTSFAESTGGFANTLGEIQGVNGFTLFGKTCFDSSGGGCPTGSSSDTGVGGTEVLASIGDPMTVTLTTEITAAAGDSSYAILDPLITIDLSTPDAQAYHILLSPGVANIGPASAVPEPSTWALMLTGLAVLGFAAHVRNGCRSSMSAA